jgi:hypothetical protein
MSQDKKIGLAKTIRTLISNDILASLNIEHFHLVSFPDITVEKNKVIIYTEALKNQEDLQTALDKISFRIQNILFKKLAKRKKYIVKFIVVYSKDK